MALGYGRNEILKGIRKEALHPAITMPPVKLVPGAEKHSLDDQGENIFGKCLRIGHGQRRAPGRAENDPFIDAELMAKRLDIVHKMTCGVLFQRQVWRGPAAAALIEQRNIEMPRVENAPVLGCAARAWPAVKKQQSYPVGRPALFPI